MRIAQITGYATSTIKHPSLHGFRLLLAESPDSPPQLVIDTLGVGLGQHVLLSSDGSEARKITGSQLSPARWFTLGILDQPPSTSHP